MYILVTYDVDTISESGQKRLRQVAKICKDYGIRVQNSVFECDVTETQYVRLKAELSDAMDNQLDSIRFYHLNKNDNRRVVTLGKMTSYNINDTIIL
ncbi:MAG: CRISPR-associated endonuclease Cas2 [Aeriscardovia sp.]|nr:CRISPR-associated endonuclease Cas2 [Aeriscardovia sp.]